MIDPLLPKEAVTLKSKEGVATAAPDIANEADIRLWGGVGWGGWGGGWVGGWVGEWVGGWWGGWGAENEVVCVNTSRPMLRPDLGQHENEILGLARAPAA